MIPTVATRKTHRIALNSKSERKVATWYRVILALCGMSLYTAFTQTSYYNVSTTITSYMSELSWDLPTILTQLKGNRTAGQDDNKRPAFRYPNVAQLVADRNNPIYTVVLPPGETTSESLHVFNDGIDQSPFLSREYNLSEFHLPTEAVNAKDTYNQTNLIWIVKGYASWQGEEGHICEIMERKIKAAMADRKQQGLPSCCWHIFVVDYTDHPDFQCRCTEIEHLMGRDFVHYAKRSIVKKRGWNETTQWIDSGAVVDNVIFEPPVNETVLGEQIQTRHVSYPVRTDLLRVFEQELQTRNNSQGRPISLSDPIESILVRPYDVTHLWNLDRNDTHQFRQGIYLGKFRWRISSILTDFFHDSNYTAFIGLAGTKDERGRRGVHVDHVRKMLESKITVVTQQDGWEDHYRLMEAMISGTMIMSDRMLSLPEGYQDGISIVLFSSPEELKEKIKYYAAPENAHERQNIAAAGRRLALQSHRSWHVLEKVIFGRAQTDCATVNVPSCPYMVDVEPKADDVSKDLFNKDTTKKHEEITNAKFVNSNQISAIKVVKETRQRHPGFMLGNRKLCRALANIKSAQDKHPYTIHLMANDCGNLGLRSFGNFLSRWYLMRLLAGTYGVTLSGSCDSNRAMSWIPTQHIQPNHTIIEGHFPWETHCRSCFEPTDELEGNPCVYPHEGKRNTSGLYHIVPTIRHDMQSVLDGVMSNKSFDIDDVVIHVRLGDPMRFSNDFDGLVKYQSYVKYIPTDAKSIGIVTAPFDMQHEGNNSTLNQLLVENLHSYLVKSFPSANVTIRNSKNEPADAVFGRLLAARTLFCGPSTDCLIPALGRTGETIVIQSALFGGSPGWLDEVAKRYNNFRYVAEPIVGANVMYNSTGDDILASLLHDEVKQQQATTQQRK